MLKKILVHTTGFLVGRLDPYENKGFAGILGLDFGLDKLRKWLDSSGKRGENMNNKAAGTQFEKEFSQTLSEHGFWVHLFQDNRNGQPCDVIAARSGRAYLIDCKDCRKDFFRLSRMEENQLNAMKLFELTGNGSGKFAIRFPRAETYLVNYWQLAALKDRGYKKIDPMDCRLYGVELSAWLAWRDRVDGWSEETCKL